MLVFSIEVNHVLLVFLIWSKKQQKSRFITQKSLMLRMHCKFNMELLRKYVFGCRK